MTVGVEDDFVNYNRSREYALTGDLVGKPGDEFLANSYRFPRVLYFADSLHVIYNEIEDIVKSLTSWKCVGDSLKSIASWLANRDLRYRFVEACLQGHANSFISNIGRSICSIS